MGIKTHILYKINKIILLNLKSCFDSLSCNFILLHYLPGTSIINSAVSVKYYHVKFLHIQNEERQNNETKYRQ